MCIWFTIDHTVEGHLVPKTDGHSVKQTEIWDLG